VLRLTVTARATAAAAAFTLVSLDGATLVVPDDREQFTHAQQSQ
jgi:hypothetical protein